MGTKLFSAFQADLTFNLGKRSDVADYVGDWINTAYMTLTTGNRVWGLKKDFYFPELETSTTASTVDGTAYVSVPTDALIVRTVWDSTSDRKLDRIELVTYSEYTGRADTTAEDAPTKYMRRGGYLYLYPTPDAVYSLTIYYRKRPTLLSGASDVTAIGAEWDEPLVKLATAQSWLRLQNIEKYKLWREEFLSDVSALIGIYDQEERDEKGFIRPDPAYMIK